MVRGKTWWSASWISSSLSERCYASNFIGQNKKNCMLLTGLVGTDVSGAKSSSDVVLICQTELGESQNESKLVSLVTGCQMPLLCNTRLGVVAVLLAPLQPSAICYDCNGGTAGK